MATGKATRQQSASWFTATWGSSGRNSTGGGVELPVELDYATDELPPPRQYLVFLQWKLPTGGCCCAARNKLAEPASMWHRTYLPGFGIRWPVGRRSWWQGDFTLPLTGCKWLGLRRGVYLWWCFPFYGGGWTELRQCLYSRAFY